MDSEEFRDCKLNWSSGYLKFFGSNNNDMGRVKGSKRKENKAY